MELEPNTFWQDFTIADAFGVKAVRQTYTSSVKSWIGNVKMYTALTAVLNYKCWDWYKKGNTQYMELYRELYYKAYNKGARTFKGDEFQYFWNTLD